MRRLPPLLLTLPLALAAACAGDDAETMGSASTSETMSASSTSLDTSSAGTDATSTDATGTATDSDGTTTDATTDDTTTSTTTDDTTAGTTETTGVDTTTTSTTDDPTTTSTTDDTTTTGTTGGDDQFPPLESKEALLAWLEGGNYKAWEAESGIHPSAGPHGGQVRTFLNAALFDSFSQGLPMHPQGAVAVKELWGDGQMMIGWAVEAKVDADSMGGGGWYWYEKIGMTEYGGDKGVGLCTGCHGAGGVDYVLTPWPLQ